MDFQDIYVSQLKLLSDGFMIYRDIPYSYPPLFIYSLYPFYLVGGPFAASFPIVMADVATAPMLYLLTLEATKEKVARVAAIGYALSPFALFYEGYLWLSSQPMTVLMVASVYLASRGKSFFSLTVLAFAILFKQEAIALLPVTIPMSFMKDRKMFWKALGAFLAIIGAVSAPFLLSAPSQYLSSTSFSLVGAPNPGLTLPSFLRSPATQMPDSCKNVSVNNAFPSVAVCGNGTINLGQLTYVGAVSMIQVVGQFTGLPLLLLVLPVAVSLRKGRGMLQVWSAYSSVAFLFLFALSVHPLLRYYLVPAYALLYASSPSPLGVALVSGIQILSLLSPTGAINFVVIMGGILVVLALRESSSQGRVNLSRWVISGARFTKILSVLHLQMLQLRPDGTLSFPSSRRSRVAPSGASAVPCLSPARLFPSSHDDRRPANRE